MIRLATALTTAAAALALPAGAHALSIVEPATDCAPQPVSQPFAQWGDDAHYTEVPGGTFEQDTPAWDHSGSASVEDGNEPWRVAGDDDTSSLSLPSGSSSLSAPLCVGKEHPHFRFFAKGTSGTLRVDVRFRDVLGITHTVPVAFVGAGDGGWQVARPAPVIVNHLAGLTNTRTNVRFRFVAQSGSWRVDDVFVDPWGGR